MLWFRCHFPSDLPVGLPGRLTLLSPVAGGALTSSVLGGALFASRGKEFLVTGANTPKSTPNKAEQLEFMSVGPDANRPWQTGGGRHVRCGRREGKQASSMNRSWLPLGEPYIATCSPSTMLKKKQWSYSGMVKLQSTASLDQDAQDREWKNRAIYIRGPIRSIRASILLLWLPSIWNCVIQWYTN